MAEPVERRSFTAQHAEDKGFTSEGVRPVQRAGPGKR